MLFHPSTFESRMARTERRASVRQDSSFVMIAILALVIAAFLFVSLSTPQSCEAIRDDAARQVCVGASPAKGATAPLGRADRNGIGSGAHQE